MNPGPATGAESLASEMRAREFDKLCKREFSWDHVPLFEGTRRVLVKSMSPVGRCLWHRVFAGFQLEFNHSSAKF